MFVEKLPCEDIESVLNRYGYHMEIAERDSSKRDSSKDVLMHYPSYCINEPYRLLTYSHEWTNEEIRKDIVGVVLQFLRGQGYEVYRTPNPTPME